MYLEETASNIINASQFQCISISSLQSYPETTHFIQSWMGLHWHQLVPVSTCPSLFVWIPSRNYLLFTYDLFFSDFTRRPCSDEGARVAQRWTFSQQESMFWVLKTCSRFFYEFLCWKLPFCYDIYFSMILQSFCVFMTTTNIGHLLSHHLLLPNCAINLHPETVRVTCHYPLVSL